MARLYADENFPFPVVEHLRELGHEVLTAREMGRADQHIPDEEVLAFATAHRRAVPTLNRKHYFRLHRAGDDHGGIVACTFDPDFEAQAERIDAAIGGTEDLSGRVLRVNRPNPPHSPARSRLSRDANQG